MFCCYYYYYVLILIIIIFQLAEALEDSVAARKLQLASHFEQVLGNIEELSVLG